MIKLAREIGAKTVCTSSGYLPEGVSGEQARLWMTDSLEQILQQAEQKPQVRVGVEYEPGFFIGKASDLHPLLQSLDHPLLGVNLDIGHAVCVGEDLSRVIPSFEGKIWNMHVEDIADQVHEHLIPGRGNIDFPRIREALDRIGYQEFLTLEIYPYKQSPGESGSESLRYLQNVFSS